MRSPQSRTAAWDLLAAFTIHGHAVGYYTRGARPNWGQWRAYLAYKETVQREARAAGTRLPLVSTEAQPVIVTTRLLCSTRVHHDPENVHKGIVDALFYAAAKPGKKRGSGQDKHVGGRFEPAVYGDVDEVQVRIEWPRSAHPRLEDRLRTGARR